MKHEEFRPISTLGIRDSKSGYNPRFSGIVFLFHAKTIALYIERLRDAYLQSTPIFTPDKTIESTRE